MMKYISKLCLVSALLMTSLSAYSAGGALSGVPIKEHHFNLMGKDGSCKTCHGVSVPNERPDSNYCIRCHGTMDEIPTKENKFDKSPHDSAHYRNTLECTACHSEHKPSHAICNDCHIVEFPNLK